MSALLLSDLSTTDVRLQHSLIWWVIAIAATVLIGTIAAVHVWIRDEVKGARICAKTILWVSLLAVVAILALLRWPPQA